MIVVLVRGFTEKGCPFKRSPIIRAMQSRGIHRDDELEESSSM